MQRPLLSIRVHLHSVDVLLKFYKIESLQQQLGNSDLLHRISLDYNVCAANISRDIYIFSQNPFKQKET